MTKGQRKDLRREILRNKSRFLSILFIVALGVAFLSGIRATEPDMLISVDEYYDDVEFMDIRVISTLGLTQSDVDEISSVKGVSYACGGKYTETFAHFIDRTGQEERIETKTLKVYGYLSGINEPHVKEGEVPQAPGECFIDSHLANAYNINIGEEITLLSGTDAPLSDTLTTETYKVVGIGYSPWYLHFDRGTGSIGTGSIDYFIMIDKQCFVEDYYTEIYVQAEGAEKLISGTDEYDELVDRVVSRIKLLEKNAAHRRLEEVRWQALESAYDSDEYREKYDEEYEKALKEAKEEAYNEAYDKVLRDAYDAALSEAMETARAEALKTVKAEALEEAVNTAREEAYKTAYETARSQAYEEALKKVKEEGYAAAMEQAKAQAYDIALSQTRAQAYDMGYSQIEGYIDSICDRVVDAALKLDDDSREELIEILRDPSPTVNDRIKRSAVFFEKLGLAPPEPVDLGTMTQSRIYQLVVDALAEYIRAGEIKPENAAQIKQQVKAAVTPQVKGIYDDYFNSQFDTLYKTLFDLQFESEFEKQYGDTVRAEFDRTFDAQYKEAFDKGFDDTFEREYAPMVREQFDATFDTQYLPIIKIQFEETFENEYLDEFNEQFEKTFMEEHLGEFEEAFYEGFEKEGKPQFDSEFEKTFEDEYRSVFDDAFSTKFNEAFEEEALEKIDEELRLPKWYVFNRTASVPTYVEYIQDAQGIGKIGTVFPVIFFLVAALVALTTMTRMVDDERLQIGSLKALGYSKMSIAAKYLTYTLLASVTGSVIGFFAGEKIFPIVIMQGYGILFVDIPVMSAPYQWWIAFYSSVAAIGSVTVAALASCLKASVQKPVALMRPPAPRAGSRIILEHIPFLWKHMSFTAKASMRNLFRYKKRLFMTVFGIAGCMGLMMVGYGLKDSIMTITDTQYKTLFLYDASVTVSSDASDEAAKELMDAIDGYDGVNDTMRMFTQNLELIYGDTTRNVTLYVPHDIEKIDNYIKLRNRESGEVYAYPRTGAAISEKSARQLGVKVGDEVEFTLSDRSCSVKIEVIFENYVYHYLMISPETYEQLTGSAPECNTLFLMDESRDEELQKRLSTFIMTFPAAGGVSFISGLSSTLDNMLVSLNGVIWVLIISAGLLAFVVLYNLNNISISERRRELATIKVLGFYNGEVAAYVYRDNIWLTAFGCVAGVFFGRFLHAFVIDTVEVDMLMFGRNINLDSYITCILFTLAFAVAVNVLMYFQLKRIDMVESLKSVE
ncbi:MAG: ABC transporter permease [Lachnospiraceae bacterium]|nr:ABC transporter permease [Lachnospiraceae bacterium]